MISIGIARPLREVWFAICDLVRRHVLRMGLIVRIEGPVKPGEALYWTGRRTWTGVPIVSGITHLKWDRMRKAVM